MALFKLTELEYREIKRICLKETRGQKPFLSFEQSAFLTMEQISKQMYGHTKVILCYITKKTHRTKRKQFKNTILQLADDRITLYRR